MTSEERSKFKLCGARKRDGTPCRAFAGQGTDHRGYGRCAKHRGDTPKHAKEALAERAQVEMVKLGAPLDISPHDALLGLLRMTAGHVAWLHAEIKAIEDLSAEGNRVLIGLYSDERDRLARIAAVCGGVGIAERLVKIEEAKFAVLSEALVRAAEVAGLGEGERRRLGRALRDELSRVEANGTHRIWGL